MSAAAQERPSLGNLQQQIDDTRAKMCIHNEAKNEIRPLFCDPACPLLDELFQALAPACRPFGAGEVYGDGQFVSCGNSSGDVTAVVETIGGEDCTPVNLGGSCGILQPCPSGSCVFSSCWTTQCTTALPEQSSLVLQGVQAADGPLPVKRALSGFLCDVVTSPFESESFYWAAQMDEATAPPARDLCQPFALNANDALECIARFEAAIGQTCAAVP